MKPADARGRRRYVRLWNPLVAQDYLRDLEAPTPFLRLYLQGGHHPLTVIARREDSAVVAHARMGPLAEDRPILSETDLRALTFRVRAEFHARLVDRVLDRGAAKGHPFDRPRVARIAERVMAEMEIHRPSHVPTLKDHERLTLVLLLMHDDATEVVLTGPVIRNSLLPWSTRVDVVAKSYLTGLRRMHGLDVVYSVSRRT